MTLRDILPLSSLALLLGGCLFDGGGGPRRLAEGHYELGGRFDNDYAYEQYFVVQAGGRWEWVEYGYNAATLQLCKVTRRGGAYALADSTLHLFPESESAPKVRCGFDEDDFDAMELKPLTGAKPAETLVRAVDEKGFEAYNFQGSTKGWQEYAKDADPYGFYD